MHKGVTTEQFYASAVKLRNFYEGHGLTMNNYVKYQQLKNV